MRSTLFINIPLRTHTEKVVMVVWGACCQDLITRIIFGSCQLILEVTRNIHVLVRYWFLLIHIIHNTRLLDLAVVVDDHGVFLSGIQPESLTLVRKHRISDGRLHCGRLVYSSVLGCWQLELVGFYLVQVLILNYKNILIKYFLDEKSRESFEKHLQLW